MFFGSKKFIYFAVFINIYSTAQADLTPPEMDTLFDCASLSFSALAQTATYGEQFGGSEAEVEVMSNDIFGAMASLADYENRLSEAQKISFDKHLAELWDSVKPFEDGFVAVNRNRGQYRDRLNRNIQKLKDCAS